MHCTACSRVNEGVSTCDFGSLATFAKAMTQVFVHDGTWSLFRRRRHGRPRDVERVPGYRFVAFVQDHDQIATGPLAIAFPWPCPTACHVLAPP